MANKDIEQRIVLKGEKEYSSAIKEAQRNLKTLRSELKAETAELGKNATAQQKNETKAKSLKAQIAEQEKVVKACRDALEEVKTKYADNEDAIAKYEQKLNDARTTLANMNNQLEETGETFETIESGANSAAVENYALAESFGNIADAASNISGTIESVFTGIVSTVKDAVSAIWGEVMEIAAKADNYLDLASFLGADATDVQQWDRALKATGNDISTITSMISKVRYGGKADKVTEWFGISGENYTNDLEYIQAVIQQMYDMKDSMKAAGTWDDAMSEIFGAKKVQDVDSILSDWTDILTGLGAFDVENGGVGLTEDELQTMGDLYNQVGLLQEKWNAFKESVTTRLFGKLSLELTGNAQGMLDALITFMNADSQEERDAAIADFEKNATEAFTKIGEAIQAAAEALNSVGTELQGSENSYVKMLGDILVGISDAMEWLTDEGNTQKILDFFRTLIEIWAASKALTAIGNIGRFITSATNLWSMFGGNASGIPTAGGSDASSTVATGGSTLAGSGLLSKIGSGLSTAAETALYVAPAALFADALFHDEKLISDMMQKGAASLAETAEKQGLFAGNEYYDIWDTLNDFLTISGDTVSDKEKMDAFAEHYTQWLNDEIADSTLDSLADLMDQETWEAFNQSIADYMNGTLLDSEDAMNSFYDPLNKVLELVENSMGTDSSWWKDNVNTDETNTLNSLPGKIGAEIQNGMSGIKVVMDGETVGYLVAPYVSQEIAKTIY